jgi:hypothetical protein
MAVSNEISKCKKERCYAEDNNHVGSRAGCTFVEGPMASEVMEILSFHLLSLYPLATRTLFYPLQRERNDLLQQATKDVGAHFWLKMAVVAVKFSIQFNFSRI